LPSLKLKERRRQGAKVIKRYHAPATPYARALAHRKLSRAIKRRLRGTYHSFDPVALLAESRTVQGHLGKHAAAVGASMTDPLAFAGARWQKAQKCVQCIAVGKWRYKKRMLLPSKVDPHMGSIECWWRLSCS
jgi:hypothetical protein